MESRRRTEATHLPEEVIQHIQSFLSGREAAGTSILSRSWYTAWLTRPNLDFSELDIRMPGAFVRFVNNTMQRYHELKIKIQSFRLVMTDYKTDNNSLATRLIVKAMSLGATDLDINNSYLLLPRQVFGSSLIRLSLVGGRIDVRNHEVNCSRLESLRLSRVCIEGNNIWDIISKCPSIEELVLSLCEGVYGNSTRSFRMLVLKPAGLGVNDFLKLRVLSLETVEIGEWLFRDLSKLPCLKELTLHNCSGYKEIQICSNSLEQIVFFQGNWKRMFMVKFDVPKIRKFKFTSSYVPSLSFKTCSSEWESDISFGCMMMDSSWILKLREFLLELSSSKICLDLLINICVEEQYEFANHMIIGLPKPPIVEKLTLRMKKPSTVRLDLFWSCRPKFMTIRADNYDAVKLLCSTVIKEECENRNMSALHDLEEVDVQVGGHTAWTWRRFLPTSVLDASGWTGTEVCLQFKWG